MAQGVKNLPAMKETQKICLGSLGQEDLLEKENGNPLQYSYLKNPTEEPVQKTAKSWTRLSN